MASDFVRGRGMLGMPGLLEGAPQVQTLAKSLPYLAA